MNKNDLRYKIHYLISKTKHRPKDMFTQAQLVPIKRSIKYLYMDWKELHRQEIQEEI